MQRYKTEPQGRVKNQDIGSNLLDQNQKNAYLTNDLERNPSDKRENQKEKIKRKKR